MATGHLDRARLVDRRPVPRPRWRPTSRCTARSTTTSSRAIRAFTPATNQSRMLDLNAAALVLAPGAATYLPGPADVALRDRRRVAGPRERGDRGRHRGARRRRRLDELWARTTRAVGRARRGSPARLDAAADRVVPLHGVGRRGSFAGANATADAPAGAWNGLARAGPGARPARAALRAAGAGGAGVHAGSKRVCAAWRGSRPGAGGRTRALRLGAGHGRVGRAAAGRLFRAHGRRGAGSRGARRGDAVSAHAPAAGGPGRGPRHRGQHRGGQDRADGPPGGGAGLEGLLRAGDREPVPRSVLQGHGAWSFHLQIYFLAERFKAQVKIGKSERRSSRTARFIRRDLRQRLFEQGSMTRVDYENYVELFTALPTSCAAWTYPAIIYLHANPGHADGADRAARPREREGDHARLPGAPGHGVPPARRAARRSARHRHGQRPAAGAHAGIQRAGRRSRAAATRRSGSVPCGG